MDRHQGICTFPLGRFLGDGYGELAERMGSQACGAPMNAGYAVHSM